MLVYGFLQRGFYFWIINVTIILFFQSYLFMVIISGVEMIREWLTKERRIYYTY